MPRPEQEATTTASRRAQPRAWLRAVRWLVAASLHPRATATTLRIAADLARRMDYLEGTVLYDMLGTAARLEVSVPTVKRHVRVLRELGALVWLEHGTRKNLRLPGRAYTGTATVYGATIPPCFDVAMGHRLDGSGYAARVAGVTEAGRGRAIAETRRAAASRGRGLEPPSPSGYFNVGKAEVGGGLKDTPSAACSTASSSKKTTTGRQRGRWTGRPALQVARDISIVRQIRPRVAWTQHEGLRRLAFALRPLIDTGLDAESIVVELHSWFLDWRPARPAAFITAELRRRQRRDADLPAMGAPVAGGPTPVVAPQDSPAWREYCQRQHAMAAMHTLVASARERTDEERRNARLAALHAPHLVLDHIAEHGEDDALDLYGTWLVARYVGQAASSTIRLGGPVS
ncbi:cell wall protein [Streptomyces macrosporus]|uniref:Cell wall protein n=1 Tax=Streptomyces macrosporus TaxID=44032 RepID=A0ABN3KML2_9ACTN